MAGGDFTFGVDLAATLGPCDRAIRVGQVMSPAVDAGLDVARK